MYSAFTLSHKSAWWTLLRGVVKSNVEATQDQISDRDLPMNYYVALNEVRFCNVLQSSLSEVITFQRSRGVRLKLILN